MSSRNLIDELSNSNSNVMLYEAKPESFYDIKETKKPVKGTNCMQQLVCLEEGSVLYRNGSCTCSPSSPHKGHEFASHCFSSSNSRTQEVKKNISHSYFSQKQFEPDDDYFVEVEDISKNCPHDDFSDGVVFTKLSDCNSFAEIQHEFDGLFLKDLYGSKRSVVGTRLPIDNLARLYVPKDLKTSKLHFPVTVRADGNCLPACGSVYAFGEDINPELVRLHIIQELVTYQEYYLDKKNLVKGYCHPSKPNEMKKSYAMYSVYFIPNQTLSDEVIKDIYQKEVLALCKNKSYMRIGQIFALTSVLKMRIRNVYPDKGSPMVRKHLNRKFIPKVQVSEAEGMIMWTSTRHDNSSMSAI
ncbi:vertnin [Elysia marginata]|uniref:Vertnin n=1 Tax=Elysia marginata TaxID=1093978 RepID=A0AAV4EQY7_9GAST|nr:vertnin [Elysia marginata]